MQHGGRGEVGEKASAICSSLTGSIVDAGLLVHKTLGPGLLESAYEACLGHELQRRGLVVGRQVALPIRYQGVQLDAGYRLDIVVNDTVVVEIKAVERMIPLYQAQLMTYLRLSGYRVGFLMNFNVIKFKDGLRRLVM